MNFIPYAHQTLDREDIQSALKSLESSLVTRGPLVEEFERTVAQYCGAYYAVAFNSGTSALTAAGYAAGLSEEDTVITSPNTFVGTVSGALQKTQKLQLVDIDPKTGCGNFSSLERPKHGRLFVYPVHYSGIAIKPERPFNDAIIIEDACEAFGSLYKDGTMVGSCQSSDMTVFSFHPAKTICMGEGGLVTTNNKEYYEKLKLFRNNGIVKDGNMAPFMYEVHDVTGNYNVTEFQAALGLSQFKKLDTLVQQRNNHVLEYRKRLQHPAVSFLDETFHNYSAHNLLPVLFDVEVLDISKSELMLELNKRGIGTQVHFIPLYRHPYFQKRFKWDEKHFLNMERFYEKELSLPLFAHLKVKDIQKVCNEIIAYFNSFNSSIGDRPSAEPEHLMR